MSRRCENCGEMVSDSDKECPNCGWPIKTSFFHKGGMSNVKRSLTQTPSDYMGYLRAFFRTSGFIFITIGTLLIFGGAPIFKFIPLFILSFAIMTSPSGAVSSDEEIGLSVLKMVLGILMVVVFIALFWGTLWGTGSYALLASLVSITIGFFVSVPSVNVEGRDDSAGHLVQKFYDAGEKLAEGFKKKLPSFGSGGGIFKIIIIILIIGVGLAILTSSIAILNPETVEISMAVTGASTFIIGLVMAALSIIIGLKLGRNLNGVILGVCGGIGLAFGSLVFLDNLIAFVVFSMVVGMGILAAVPVDKVKTLIGIPILIVALGTTTFAYPDVMGTAVFGEWWPQIDYTIDSTFGPLLENIQSPLGTLGQGYSCLINPTACYLDYKPQTSTKESIRSVEVTRVDPIGVGTIDEFTDEVIVIVTVENRGKEDAENIKITPRSPVYAQGTDEEESAGNVEIRCEDGSTSTSTDTIPAVCDIKKLISGELREFVLTYYINPDTIIGGNYISVGADIEYDLDLTGQVDVMVMDEDYYLKLSKNNELVRREQITEDTGGPVRMGLALMRNEMPVRDNLEGVPVLLYLNNQGPGSIKEIDHSSVRVDINDLYVDTGETNMYCTPGTQQAGREDLELKGLEKHLDNCESPICPDGPEPVETRGDAKATCISKVPGIDVEQKTFAITGEVTYTYTHGNERKIQVEFIEDTSGGGNGGGPGGGTGECYDVDDEHDDVSCQEWCENYVNGEGGMVCDPNGDCMDGKPAQFLCAPAYGHIPGEFSGEECDFSSTGGDIICLLKKCSCEGDGGGEPPTCPGELLPPGHSGYYGGLCEDGCYEDGHYYDSGSGYCRWNYIGHGIHEGYGDSCVWEDYDTCPADACMDDGCTG